MSVGFTNHMLILYKIKGESERLYYISQCAQGSWTIDTLKYHIAEDLYHKQGSIQHTNFNHTISDNDFKRKALQSFKDEYLLDFINIEAPEDVDERVIEQSIIQNIKYIVDAGNSGRNIGFPTFIGGTRSVIGVQAKIGF
jgi:predicted nuclease of restriction endonuclease-like (RecB) superfamily